MRVGYESIIGCLKGGVSEYSKKGTLKQVNVMNLNDFKKSLCDKSRVILDVRTEVEQKSKGHIKESLKIPLQTLSDNVHLVPKDKNIVILCFSGMRATIAKTVLISKGLNNDMHIVEGGVQALIDNNFKLDI